MGKKNLYVPGVKEYKTSEETIAENNTPTNTPVSTPKKQNPVKNAELKETQSHRLSYANLLIDENGNKATKDKKVLISFYSQVYEMIKEETEEKNLSFQELINRILIEHIEEK